MKLSQLHLIEHCDLGRVHSIFALDSTDPVLHQASKGSVLSRLAIKKLLVLLLVDFIACSNCRILELVNVLRMALREAAHHAEALRERARVNLDRLRSWYA